MQSKDNIIQTLRSVLANHKIKQAAIFGSYARGDFTPDSDIDIVIELDYNHPLTETLYGFWDDAEAALGRPVDVLSFRSLTESTKQRFKQNVLNEMEWFYEALQQQSQNNDSKCPATGGKGFFAQ